MLTREQIADIADECFAADVQYSYEKLKHWDEDRVRQYFEDGGEKDNPVGPFYAPLVREIQTRAHRISIRYDVCIYPIRGQRVPQDSGRRRPRAQRLGD